MIEVFASSDSGAIDAATHRRVADKPAPWRYDRVAAWLHWGIGALLLAEIAFGLLLDDIAPRATPARGSVINLHKSIGIVLGILIVVRVAWRLVHAPPRWPASMSPARRRAAQAGHAALYACMVIVPLSGYLGSNFSRRGVRFFGAELPPWGIDSSSAYAFLVRVHDWSSYLLLALTLGHVAMALRHAFVERDGIFARIVPWRPAHVHGPSS
ncbi:MAG: cytochrome b [Rhizobacter sp.]|nr:cytochrome b [Rhizobacter sp.]